MLFELRLRREVVLHETVSLAPDHIVQQTQAVNARDVHLEQVLNHTLKMADTESRLRRVAVHVLSKIHASDVIMEAA